MSLIFFDGFDQYVSPSDAVNYGGWSSQSINSASISTTTRLSSGNSYKFNEGGGNPYLIKGFTSDKYNTSIFMGAAFRHTLLESHWLYSLLDSTGAEQCTVCTVPSGLGDLVIQLKRGSTVLATGTTPIYLNTWKYIEANIKVHSSTGTIEVRLDGQVELTFSGNTQNTTSATVTSMKLMGGTFTGTIQIYVDDFYLLDSSGSINNTYLGEVRTEFKSPNGDNAVAWTKNSGTYNYQAVDEILGSPDNDSTYVSSNTHSQKDEYSLSNLSTPALIVPGIRLITRAEKDNVGPLSLKTGIKVGIIDQQNLHSLSMGYVNFIDIFETSDGAGTAFTPTTINSLLSTIQIP